ncbi:hypothetical protein [Microaceticoccus formicicus]|uniref:hypothetical protein n=1 Tax=Microaceticoccus formicicus TaxID=3118105 RepID=UPI003CCFFBDD|nr:hypothetical protein VZL98_05050 [Peptoniphilaceae bacterium AMB_02]
MRELLLQEILIPVITSIVLAGLSYLIAYTTGVLSNIKDKRVAYHLFRATEIVEQAVRTVNQNWADQMKQEGSFNKESAMKAFQEAMNLSRNLISSETQKVIVDAHKDYQLWLQTQIEKQVSLSKANKELILTEYEETRP